MSGERVDEGRAAARGVVAVLTSQQHGVVVSVSDFDESGYGGFTLREAQEHRARRGLAFAMVRAYCSNVILDVMDPYDCEQMLRKLERKGSHKVTLIPVGHPAD